MLYPLQPCDMLPDRDTCLGGEILAALRIRFIDQ